MTLQSYTPTPLSNRELDLLKTLRTHLHLNGTDTFTTDTLRQLQFDRFMPKDKLGRRNFGSLILKWEVFGYIEKACGTVCSQYESNHAHRIQVWKMKP